MKETLKQVSFEAVPESAEEFRRLFEANIGTVEGAAAVFVLALLIMSRDRSLGQECLNFICAEPPEERAIDAAFPRGEDLARIAGSYFEEGRLTVTVKLTGERMKRRHFRTVYVGSSAAGSYRPVTLRSKPPRYYKKRFGITREYDEDPWQVTDYPSLLLPVPQKS